MWSGRGEARKDWNRLVSASKHQSPSVSRFLDFPARAVTLSSLGRVVVCTFSFHHCLLGGGGLLVVGLFFVVVLLLLLFSFGNSHASESPPGAPGSVREHVTSTSGSRV